MGTRHLQELLREEQDPFVLKDFLDERRRKMLNIRRVHSTTTTTTQNHYKAFCQSPSFLHFLDPSSSKRSPLFDCPAKSPATTTRTSRITIGLLLEAAVKIQRHQSKKMKKKTTREKAWMDSNNGLGFGVLFSFLWKLQLKKPQKEITGHHQQQQKTRVSVKDILEWENSPEMMPPTTKKKNCYREEKETMTSTVDPFLYRGSFVRLLPMSSFSHLSVEEEGGREHCREEEFRSPAEASPSCRRTERQLFGGTGGDGVMMMTGDNSGTYSVEDKDRFSPVSVLEPPSEDEVDHTPVHHNNNNNDDDDDEKQKQQEDEVHQQHVHGIERSLAVVQSSRKQLLGKMIRRIGRLAGLEPVDLDKRIDKALEEEEEVGDNDHDDCWDNNDDHLVHGNLLESTDDKMLSKNEIPDVHEFIKEDSCNDHHHAWKLSHDLMRLVVDLVEEEKNREEHAADHTRVVVDYAEAMAAKVCRRFEEWEEVDSNTIDMMVERDMNHDGFEWKRSKEQVTELVLEIECAIFCFLIREISDDLIN